MLCLHRACLAEDELQMKVTYNSATGYTHNNLHSHPRRRQSSRVATFLYYLAMWELKIKAPSFSVVNCWSHPQPAHKTVARTAQPRDHYWYNRNATHCQIFNGYYGIIMLICRDVVYYLRKVGRGGWLRVMCLRQWDNNITNFNPFEKRNVC